MYNISVKDIKVRDPYIVTDREKECYYLFGTTDLDP